MTIVSQLAHFVTQREFDDISEASLQRIEGPRPRRAGMRRWRARIASRPRVRAQVDEFGGRPLCTLIGGGRTAPDRAALYNGALVRYLDFNDSYFAPGETCHPSDNFAPVLAAAEYGRRLRPRTA